MRPGIPAAVSTALLTFIAGCAPPSGQSVRTEAEAIGLARGMLVKAGLDAEPLTGQRHGETWLVTTPRVHKGQNWTQMMVRIDRRTGRASIGSVQTATIDVDLTKPD